MSDTERETILKDVLDRELAMFQTVNAVQRASCQDDPDTFRVMRGAQFASWSRDTLESYRDDLKDAAAKGKNLMTLKYARMDELIPPISQNPHIAEIVEIQLAWQRDLARRFPRVTGHGRKLTDEENPGPGTSFATYLAGELETYSDRTLSLLMRDVTAALAKGTNLAETVYTAMVRGLGYASLADAEASAGRSRDPS